MRPRRNRRGALRRVLAVAVIVLTPGLFGFDTVRHSIALDRIVSGGPPKDGIPALMRPRFVVAGEATFLAPDDRVVGVALGGEVRAYPLRILNWHEAVNDVVGATPVAVTYCPLTASAVVFDRSVGGEILSFGISGRLYQSNVLLYDHQSESLWSQLREEAVTGPRTGDRLRALPAVTTTWAAWRSAHPDTLVLSLDTGHQRDYARDAYARYHASPEIMFPVDHRDGRLAPKEQVLGIRIGDRARAYPIEHLAAVGHLDDRIEDSRLRITADPSGGDIAVTDLNTGQRVPVVEVYWFAWAAFHPGTTLWQAGPKNRPAVGRPAAGGVSGSADGAAGVEIISHTAYWTDILGLGIAGSAGVSAGDGDGAGPLLLVVSGALRNGTGHSLDHVRLQFELIDERGRAVASESGYNRRAEALRPVDALRPAALLEREPVEPIADGEEDAFRMMFLRDETPPFSRYRIRVVEAVPPK